MKIQWNSGSALLLLSSGAFSRPGSSVGGWRGFQALRALGFAFKLKWRLSFWDGAGTLPRKWGHLALWRCCWVNEKAHFSLRRLIPCQFTQLGGLCCHCAAAARGNAFPSPGTLEQQLPSGRVLQRAGTASGLALAGVNSGGNAAAPAGALE